MDCGLRTLVCRLRIADCGFKVFYLFYLRAERRPAQAPALRERFHQSKIPPERRPLQTLWAGGRDLKSKFK
ncbi:hypothetical protein D1AOALGA4SA_1034 [Olavius algarvensis Delta 1 endosymbiont]|nr:hypothetical protein D1AOALGA4SA_1034 [Olavius algarvensis Delta 1 endosymbiont]